MREQVIKEKYEVILVRSIERLLRRSISISTTSSKYPKLTFVAQRLGKQQDAYLIDVEYPSHKGASSRFYCILVPDGESAVVFIEGVCSFQAIGFVDTCNVYNGSLKRDFDADWIGNYIKKQTTGPTIFKTNLRIEGNEFNKLIQDTAEHLSLIIGYGSLPNYIRV